MVKFIIAFLFLNVKYSIFAMQKEWIMAKAQKQFTVKQFAELSGCSTGNIYQIIKNMERKKRTKHKYFFLEILGTTRILKPTKLFYTDVVEKNKEKTNIDNQLQAEFGD